MKWNWQGGHLFVDSWIVEKLIPGALNESSGHIQGWVVMALGIWELLSSELEVPQVLLGENGKE